MEYNIGSKIKELRKARKLTLQAVARETGFSPALISQIENNNKEPNLSTLKTISSKLETPLPILFFLSIDSDDISPEKEDAFNIIAPSVKSLINQFFAT